MYLHFEAACCCKIQIIVYSPILGSNSRCKTNLCKITTRNTTQAVIHATDKKFAIFAKEEKDGPFANLVTDLQI
jgi:hypothetical protein